MQNNAFQLTGVDLVVPVKGLEGAKSYPQGPNCRTPLFDDSEDILYIKTTDANGFPSIKMYDLTERVLIDENSPAAISLNDIRSLIREELSNVKEELINAQQPISLRFNSTAQSDVNTGSSVIKHNGNASKPAGSKPATAKQSGTNSSGMESRKE